MTTEKSPSYNTKDILAKMNITKEDELQFDKMANEVVRSLDNNSDY